MKFRKTTMLGTSLAILLVLGTTTVFATSAPQDMATEKNAGTAAGEKTNVYISSDGPLDGMEIDLGDGHLITLEEYEASMKATVATLKADVAAGKINQAEMDERVAGMEQTKKDLASGAVAIYQLADDTELPEGLHVSYSVSTDTSEIDKVNLEIEDGTDLLTPSTEAE